MTVTITETAPTGDSERSSVHLVANLDEGSGVDSSTIALTVTDPLDTAHSVIAAGAIVSGWNGAIVADGTGYDIIVYPDDPMMAGLWTASITADSLAGSEDGTSTWTWTVDTVLRAIDTHMGELVEGSVGTGRTVTSGRFRRVPHPAEKNGANAGSGSRHAFSIFPNGPGPAIDGYFSGSHSLHTAVAEMQIVAAHKPLVEQDAELHRDLTIIQRCFDWPNNWVLVEGLCGLEITNWSIDTTNDPPVQVLMIEVTITYREYQP